jgi:hypothetical protein
LFKSLMGMLERESAKIYENIRLQVRFRKQLLELSRKVKENKKEKLQTKKETLRRLVNQEGIYDMRRFDPPLPMPVEPRLLVHGIEASSCTMFQSAMCPLKLDFYTYNKLDTNNKE